jgi:filamentous hemagglutinin family protein
MHNGRARAGRTQLAAAGFALADGRIANGPPRSNAIDGGDKRDQGKRERGKSMLNGVRSGAWRLARLADVSRLALMAAAGTTLSTPLWAQSLPTSGQVVAGSLVIGAPSAHGLTVTQSSHRGIVNWQGFSIGRGNTVTFQQPSANAATLNRVTGATTSTIAGQLRANGQIYLVNPNGIQITSSGVVKSAGFTASSLAIADGDFLAGHDLFTGDGHSAAVRNRGMIRVRHGGAAVLLGGQVANAGTIAAPGGRVGLGAGERIAVDIEGDGFLTVTVPTTNSNRAKALIVQAGQIQAAGGRVDLRAATSADVARAAIRLTGSIEAGSVTRTRGAVTFGGAPFAASLHADTRAAAKRGVSRPALARVAKTGRVTIDAGPGGSAVMKGKINVSGTSRIAGGTVDVRGQSVVVAGDILAKGATGGSVTVSALQNVNLSASVDVRGLAGPGGSVTVTGNVITLASATLDASGTTQGGVIRIGGDFHGASDLLAAQSVTMDAATLLEANATGTGTDNGGSVVVWSNGTTDVHGTISAQGGPNGGDGGQVETSGHTVDFSGIAVVASAKLGTPGTWLVDPTDLTIDAAAATTIEAGLDGGTDVTLQTTGNGGTSGPGTRSAGSGDINVTSALAWSSSATLTLDAFHDIAIDGDVSAAAGGLVLSAGNALGASGNISLARFTLQSGNWVQNTATLPAFSSGDFEIPGGTFLRATGGQGTATSPYSLVDIYGVQGIATLPSKNYQLAANIDASQTATWNAGAGFVPIGPSYFTGTFDGAGHTITNLAIDRPNAGIVGLFAVVAGTVTNVGLVGGSVTGQTVGELAGTNFGVIREAYATGAVSGSVAVGGLVGSNEGTITQTYSTGAVTGSRAAADVGGLVGFNDHGAITQAYASGAVSGLGFLGGLVGVNAATITGGYYDSYTTGQQQGALVTTAGVSAVTSDPAVTQTAYQRSAYGGLTFASSHGWFMVDGMTRPFLSFEYSTTITNAHQLQLVAMNPSASYTLANNIDLSSDLTGVVNKGQTYYPGLWSAAGFAPIGDQNTFFQGTFDGAGHTIANLFINRPTASFVGLFGAAYGTVENIGLLGGSVTGAYDVGALVGYNLGTISQAYATGTVTGAGLQSGAVGGLAGLNEGTIIDAYATGAVSAHSAAGGLVGENDRGSITRAYATGATTSIGPGGLVGDNTGTITQAYATGAVNGTSSGGIAGYNGGTITDSYFDSYTTGMTRGVGVGGGGGSAVTSDPSVTQTAYQRSAYGGLTFASTNGWFLVDGLTRPFLSFEYSTTITNAHQLQLVAMNLGGSYTLANNIDLSNDLAGVVNGGNTYYPGLWGAAGFAPIGNSNTTFTGTFDGAGHTIASLVIDQPNANNIGLFGEVGTGGTVANIGLVGGSVTGADNVGSLVGVNHGAVTQAYATGAVSAVLYEGGLVGENYGTITQAYSTGAVSPGAAFYAGGLVGANEGTITQAYATGAVSGADFVGGLVGTNDGTITQAYSTGLVSGFQNTGGLVGTNSGTVTQSYWDRTTTHQNTSAGGTGLTTAQMQDLSGAPGSLLALASAAGWDFANVWSPPNQVGQNNRSGTAYYPQLYALSDVTTILPTSTTRTFGSANPILTASYDGVHAGDYVTTSATLSTNARTMDDVGIYGIVASGAATTSAAGDVYRYVYEPGNLVVAPEPLTVTAGAKSKVYGTNDPTLTYAVTSGSLFNGDSLAGALARAGYGTRGGEQVGSYAIRQGTLSASGNYSLTYTGAILAITPAPLSIAANAQSKVYGTNDPPLTYSQTGLVDGLVDGVVIDDGLAGALARANSGTLPGEQVGSYAIQQGTLGASRNYSPTYTGATLAITPAPLSIAANAQSKVYGTNDPTLTYNQTGLVDGLVDGVMIDDGMSAALSRANYGTLAGEQVGSYAIQQGNFAASGNYDLTYVGANLAITQAPLNVTANRQSKIYGTDDPSLTYRQTGLADGLVDGVLINDGLSGSLARASYGTLAGEQVGSYAIRQGTIAASGNYSLRYTGADLAITKASLSIAANAQSKIYGTDDPSLTYRQTGLVDGLVDGVLISDGLLGGLARAAYGTLAGEQVGSYAIQQGTLAASSNYSLSYTGANLAITKASLTITADAQSKIYGTDGPALTYSRAGLVDAIVDGVTISDRISGLELASPGSPPSANVAGSPYAVSASNAVGSGLTNYQIGYVDGALIVTPRDIAVAAVAVSRVYGTANPTLTYQVGGLGLVGSDTLSGGLATDATTSSHVGTYGITLGTLANPDYAISYTGASLAVTPRPIGVAAEDATKRSGTADPTLAYSISSGNLLTGDSFSGAPVRDPGETVGNYQIRIGSLTAGSDYLLTFANGTFTITANQTVPVAPGEQAAQSVGLPTQTLASLLPGPPVGGGSVEGIYHPGVSTTPTISTDTSPASVAGVNPIVTGSIGAPTNPTKSYCFVGTGYTLLCVGASPSASH